MLHRLSGSLSSCLFRPDPVNNYLYKNGFQIAQVFYGLWLFPLGYLVYKSGFLPKVLGIVLMVHCCTWSATALQFFLFPGFTAITYLSWPLGFVAEVGLSLSLLLMGFRAREPQRAVVA